MYLQVISPGIYSLTRWGWENPKPRFWHFEPWFPKVLEISENTLLYITVGSFGKTVDSMAFLGNSRRPAVFLFWFFKHSGTDGSRVPTLVAHVIWWWVVEGGWGEGFYIRLWCDERGMQSDRHSFPLDRCDALWRSGLGLYTWPMQKPWWSNLRHRQIGPSNWDLNRRTDGQVN
jgi:hypothetical protein